MRIKELKGIGDKTEKIFNALGLFDTDDLLEYYPRTYDVYKEPVRVCEMSDESINYAFWGRVATSFEINNKGRYNILSLYAEDEDGARVKLTWFNMPFMRNNLKRGGQYIFRGKVAFKGSLVFMQQPVLYSREQYALKMDTLQPVYRLTTGLSNNMVIKAIKQCLEISEPQEEYLPKSIIEKYGFMDRHTALERIHFPHNTAELTEARKRMVFDEFFMFTMRIRSLKTVNLIENNNYAAGHSKLAQTILGNLGYELTAAQQKVYNEIVKDMSGKITMNRLIQGDVGSGKTIVALLAMMNMVNAGYQSVIMAPTEVLASQHYQTFTELIEKNKLNVKCTLLTGSLTMAERRRARESIATGETDIIIGTHAVITEGVDYCRLGLVVTDEQHRFGVRQRETLHNKGSNPHIIVMSATPIPRSLAIILYGDLDISIIDEKPASRLEIKNCVVDTSYRQRAYKFINDEIEKGHQAYIICSMAVEGDNDEGANLENVVEYSAKIRDFFPKKVVITYLHGKMKPAEKKAVMDSFARNEIQILVSTTVIEVGINVPNATVMMVENAERFGLAGLHQLRGRVGRGSEQSYCIFVSNTRSKETKERLNILNQSNDGFYIAEQDLKLRGAGEMLGTRQSGDFGFRVGDVYADSFTLKLASDITTEILDTDSALEKEENRGIRLMLQNYNLRDKDILIL